MVVQVRELESDPIFNSGRGSALTANGTVEMEASIMDGDGRRCGAVSGISTVKNPISLARLVMDKSPHSYLAFSGAEEFAKQQVKKNDQIKKTLIVEINDNNNLIVKLIFIIRVWRWWTMNISSPRTMLEC